jgi:hypothetical protein
MDQTAKDLLLKAVTRLPEWIRHDLTAKDPVTRRQAEESLAAMLVATIENEMPVAEHGSEPA